MEMETIITLIISIFYPFVLIDFAVAIFEFLARSAWAVGIARNISHPCGWVVLVKAFAERNGRTSLCHVGFGLESWVGAGEAGEFFFFLTLLSFHPCKGLLVSVDFNKRQVLHNHCA